MCKFKIERLLRIATLRMLPSCAGPPMSAKNLDVGTVCLMRRSMLAKMRNESKTMAVLAAVLIAAGGCSSVMEPAATTGSGGAPAAAQSTHPPAAAPTTPPQGSLGQIPDGAPDLDAAVDVDSKYVPEQAAPPNALVPAAEDAGVSPGPADSAAERGAEGSPGDAATVDGLSPELPGGQTTSDALNAPMIYDSYVWTGFDPVIHGWSFANANWGRICWRIDGLSRFRYDPSDGYFCDSNWGLCGGMALTAGERFRSGNRTAGISQAAAKQVIVDGQFRTLDPVTVDKWLNWIASPDVGHWYDPSHSVAWRMNQDWQNQIRPRLDRGEPVVTGVIFSKRARVIDGRSIGALADLSEQHVVLVVGHRESKTWVELLAYDSNRPGAMVVLTFTKQKPGVTYRLFSEHASYARPYARAVMFIR
jgi:hypothetical protein